MELSIEEKAKRYDEAIERAKNTIEVNQTVPDIVECVESLFPELKESEDEKIRKWLICYFKDMCDNVSEKEKKCVLAWLEKKGEQKPAEWSEEDEKMLSNIVDCIKNLPIFYESIIINGEDKITEGFICDVINWLKSFKDRVQTKHEWNEDDNLQLQAAIDICKSSGHTITSDWLKSLKERYTWKPNKEQIDVVKHVIDHVSLAARDRSILDDLYLDLRRLTNYE